jgi:exonuclease III
MGSENIIGWNVHDLNTQACCDVVRELVSSERHSLVCLQEAILHVIDDYGVMQLLGVGFEYSYLPSTETHGGILFVWKAVCWAISNTIHSHYSVSIKINHISKGGCQWLISVYGPADDVAKLAFLDELHQFRSAHPEPWLLVSDINMIYEAVHKNNSHLNHQLMGQFC